MQNVHILSLPSIQYIPKKNTASSLSFVDYTIQNQVAPTHKVQVNFDIFWFFRHVAKKNHPPTIDP